MIYKRAFLEWISDLRNKQFIFQKTVDVSTSFWSLATLYKKKK